MFTKNVCNTLTIIKEGINNTVYAREGTGGQIWRRLKRIAMWFLKTCYHGLLCFQDVFVWLEAVILSSKQPRHNPFNGLFDLLVWRFYVHLIIRFPQQALYTYADKLQEVKADKEQVAMEMDVVCKKRFLPLPCHCAIWCGMYLIFRQLIIALNCTL